MDRNHSQLESFWFFWDVGWKFGLIFEGIAGGFLLFPHQQTLFHERGADMILPNALPFRMPSIMITLQLNVANSHEVDVLSP